VTNPDHDLSPVPDLFLERYRLGEMSPTETARFRQRLETDKELRTRLRALDESDEEIRRRYPSGWLEEHIRQRLRENASRRSPSVGQRSFGWRLPIAVAVSAFVVLGVGWRLLGPLHLLREWMAPRPVEQSDRIKGGNLAVFRKTAEGSEVLGDGDRAHAGDQIRIAYRSAGRSYGVILSIDGRGVVTRHFPLRGERAALLTHGGLVLLDHAYELDDAPGWEKFYLVTGHTAFKLAPVLEAARTLAAGTHVRPPGALTFSAPLEQTSLILMKEATR
jgi:anti-sigma factor RsiW